LLSLFVCFFILPPPPTSPLFPYTTLFRSAPSPSRVRGLGPALLDHPEHAVRGLLDRELRDVDHRAAELAVELRRLLELLVDLDQDRKSTRLNSSHDQISYAVFCLKKKKNK